jgi:hypothetical protein
MFWNGAGAGLMTVLSYAVNFAVGKILRVTGSTAFMRFMVPLSKLRIRCKISCFSLEARWRHIRVQEQSGIILIF